MLTYWIEQTAILSLALARLGHTVTLAYLPYAHWTKPISRFDLRRQSLYMRMMLKPLEALLDPSSFEEVYDNEENGGVWDWDRESRARAQGMLAALKSSENIVSLIVAKNALEVLRPITVKLQKQDQDLYQAYNLIDGATERLTEIRANLDNEFKDWFSEAKGLADQLSEELRVRRVTGRQVHRANASSESPEEHFKRNVAIPFLDHLIMELSERFQKDSRVGQAIFALIPKQLLEIESNLQDLKEKLLFWESDLESPSTLLAELKEWVAHWKHEQGSIGNFPANLIECVPHADGDQFPNIRKLFLIGCVLPVGSAEAERSFSAFRRLKTHLRSTMGDERLSGLALMNIHHDMEIDLNIISQTYIKKNNRRMFENCVIRDSL
jgi:hypothetical protein